MYTALNNFRYGLDSRRSELSAVPGTLVEALDGHITQGGEFEKRKAFVKTTLPLDSNNNPVVGSVVTALGIYVFSTDALVAVNAPLIYQQLLHPKTVAGLGAVVLTSIVASDQFNNLPFVAAQFADGSVFCYYNGALVTDFTSGLVASFMTTNAQVAANLTAMTNAVGLYTALQDSSTLAHEFDLFSQPGNEYTIATQIAATCNITVSTNQDTSYTSGNVFSTNGLNAVNGSVLTIGGQVYRFRNTLAQAYDVQIGAGIADSVSNLYLAINASGVVGTNYYAGTLVNANVYAQNLILANTPSFQFVAFVTNIEGQVQNNLIGLGYAEEAATVPKAIAIQASGQFKIQAFAPAQYATAVISKDGSTTMPTVGTTITINGIVYTFTTNTALVGGILIPAAGVGAVSQSDVLMLNIIHTINNLQFYRIGVTLVQAGFPPFTGAGLTNTFFTAGALIGTGSTASFILTANAVGSAANAYAISRSGASAHVTVPATFTGGVSSAITAITVGPTAAWGTIVTSGVNPANNATVTIGGVTYTFVTATPAATNQVFIGANAQIALMNLVQAINFTGVQLLDYDVNGPNQQVLAADTLNGNTVLLVARNPGSAGNALVLATSSATLTLSGATLLNGADLVSLMPSAVSGLVSQTAADFANSVLLAINNYTSTSGYYATLVANTVYIYSQAGNSFSNNAVVTVTVAGQVCIGFCAVEFFYPAIVNNNSVIGLTGWLREIQISGVKQLNGVTSYQCGPGQTYATIELMLAQVATDFNANTAHAGVAGNAFAMVAIGAALYISKLVTASTDAPLSVNVVTNTSGTSGASSDQMSSAALGQDNLLAVASPNYVNFIRHAAGGTFQRNSLLTPNSIGTDAALWALGGGDLLALSLTLKGLGLFSSQKMVTDSYSPVICTCQASGGYPPYRYTWQWMSGDAGFIASNPTNTSITFFRQDTAGSQTSYWSCLVTDSLGNFANSNQIRVHQP